MVLGGTLTSLAVIPPPAFSQHCLCTQLPFTCAVGFLGTAFCEILCTSSPSLPPLLSVWKADRHTQTQQLLLLLLEKCCMSTRYNPNTSENQYSPTAISAAVWSAAILQAAVEHLQPYYSCRRQELSRFPGWLQKQNEYFME